MARPSIRSALSLGPLVLATLLFAAAHLRYAAARRADESLATFVSHMEGNRLAEARVELRAALDTQPDNAHFLSNAGLLHAWMARREFTFEELRRPVLSPAGRDEARTAIDYYRRVCRLNPHDDHAFHNLGWLYWISEQPQEVFESFRRAVEIDGDIVLYRLSLGMLHEYTGDEAQAFAQYAQALRQSPGILDSRFFMELERRSPDRTAQMLADAIAHFESRTQATPDPIAQSKLGKLYLRTRPEPATKLLVAATSTLPGLSRPWFNLGYAYELQGDEKRMEQCYRKAVFLDSQEVQSWYRLGAYYERARRQPEALRAYRQSVDKWLNRSSTHATRVRRIYISRYTLHDDVLPRGLMSYTDAAFDITDACTRLAALYRQNGDHASAERYEKIAREYAL